MATAWQMTFAGRPRVERLFCHCNVAHALLSNMRLTRHWAQICNVVPPSCIQMRNLILSAFPRNMRLPDPFTPNLKARLTRVLSPACVRLMFMQLSQPSISGTWVYSFGQYLARWQSRDRKGNAFNRMNQAASQLHYCVGRWTCCRRSAPGRASGRRQSICLARPSAPRHAFVFRF